MYDFQPHFSFIPIMMSQIPVSENKITKMMVRNSHVNVQQKLKFTKVIMILRLLAVLLMISSPWQKIEFGTDV